MSSVIGDIPRHVPIVRSSEVVESRIEDTLIMLSVRNASYYSLAKTGDRIWSLLESPCTFDEIVAILMNEYKVEPKVCERDLAEFLGKLAEYDLVRFAGSSGI